MTQGKVNPNIDQWGGAEISKFEAAVSTDRFARYVEDCEDNRIAAFRRYGWNTTISAAFYGPLQVLEVTLRNSFHNALKNVYGVDWYEDGKIELNDYERKKINSCKRRLNCRNARLAEIQKKSNDPSQIVIRPVEPPDIVAGLNFGFWVSLLGPKNKSSDQSQNNKYEEILWKPALQNAFRYATNLERGDAVKLFGRLKWLRNRIAHHEPIYHYKLERDYRNILKALSWLSPEMHTWVKASSRINELLEENPKGLLMESHVKF